MNTSIVPTTMDRVLIQSMDDGQSCRQDTAMDALMCSLINSYSLITEKSKANFKKKSHDYTEDIETK